MIEPVASPVIGYRLWQTTHSFDRLLPLGFYTANDAWLKPEAEADCHLPRLRHERAHATPVEICTCGLHGWKTYELMLESHESAPPGGGGAEALIGSRGMAAKPVVRGAVVAWGRIIEHELGFRAQHMRALALLDSVGSRYLGGIMELPVLAAAELTQYAGWFGEELAAGA